MLWCRYTDKMKHNYSISWPCYLVLVTAWLSNSLPYNFTNWAGKTLIFILSQPSQCKVSKFDLLSFVYPSVHSLPLSSSITMLVEVIEVCCDWRCFVRVALNVAPFPSTNEVSAAHSSALTTLDSSVNTYSSNSISGVASYVSLNCWLTFLPGLAWYASFYTFLFVRGSGGS